MSNADPVSALTVSCPACAAQFSVSESISSTTATCPACGTEFAIAEAAASMPVGTESAVAHTLPQPSLGAAVLWCLGWIVFLQLMLGFLGGYSAAKSAHAVHHSLAPELLLYTPEFARGMLPWMAAAQVLSIAVFILIIPLTLGSGFCRKISLGLPKAFHLLLALLGLPGLMIVAIGVGGIAKEVLPPLIDVDSAFSMTTAWPLMYGLLIIGLGPGIGEELWFRGFIGRGLVGRFGVVAGVLLTSLLFGLVHLDPRHALVTFAIGVLLHLAFLASRSLFIPMLLHVLNNSLSVLAMHYPHLGFNDLTAQEIPPSVYAAAVVLIAAVGWSWYQTRVREPNESQHTPMSTASKDDVGGVVDDGRISDLRRLALVGLAPLVAFTLFAGVTVPKALVLSAKVAPLYPSVPTTAEVSVLLQREPFSSATWPAWSKRLREWLPDRGLSTSRAFEAARLFLRGEFEMGNPRSPMREDAMAWYIYGRGLLLRFNNNTPVLKIGSLAEPVLRQSIQLDPDIGRAHYALAVALYLQSTYGGGTNPQVLAEAQREAELGEKLDPTCCAKAARAWAAMMFGRFDEAEIIYTEINDDRPHDMEMRRAAAEARALANQQRLGSTNRHFYDFKSGSAAVERRGSQ